MSSAETPKTEQEKDLGRELKNARQQVVELRRMVSSLERDNRLLSIMGENADRLRRSNESEKKLQDLYNDMLLKFCPNMLFLFDKELRLQLATRSCLALLPFNSLEEMKNLSLGKIFGGKMDSAWIERVFAECRGVLDGGDSQHYTCKIVFTGAVVGMDAQVDISPIIDEDSRELRGVIVSINDISELTVVKEHAEEASRSKSSFLANMSHEIRTPMNAVKGLSELLMLTELSELQKAYVSNIISSSNSLLTIINDILDLSKIEANKVDIITSEYNLGGLIKDVCSIINLRAVDKELALNINVDPRLPSILYGDDIHLRQVLVNVLSNAVKYTEKGMITLSVSGWRNNESELQLKFAVTDTGIGINSTELPNLFQAFNRADLRLNRGILGTGLGLAISKQLMLAMGGDIAVESTYGQGSTFSFWLSQKVVNAVRLAEVQSPERKKALLLDTSEKAAQLAKLLDSLDIAHLTLNKPEVPFLPCAEGITHCIYFEGYPDSLLCKLRESMPEVSFIIVRDISRAMEEAKHSDMAVYEPLLVKDLAMALDLSRKCAYTQSWGTVNGDKDKFKVIGGRALVVDDNALNLMVGSEILRSFGFEVDEAGSGAAAAQSCRENLYDIIFMDHMMPDMDGVEAVAHIRAEPGRNLQTPIIALTANVVSGMRDYFLHCGMNDMVSKPIEVADLGRAILAWMPRSKIRKDGQEQDPQADGPAGRVEFTLIELLDEVGVFASEVMRELDGDLPAYTARLAYASKMLSNLLPRLKVLLELDDLESFSRAVAELEVLLYGIGARNCAARAKKMAAASAKGNIACVQRDFKSLMGNMYMLEKKLEALMPLATGEEKYDSSLHSARHIYRLLKELQAAIDGHKSGATEQIIEDLARSSFDHDLNRILNEVRWALEEDDFEAAGKCNAEALGYYSSSHPGS